MQTVGGPAFLFVVGTGLSIVSLADGTPREALPLFVVMAAGGGFMFYWWLRFPSTIEWHGDGTVSFKGPVRTVCIPLSAIESIRPYGLGFLALRYSRKKLLLLNQFDDFHEFIYRLQQAKPGVEIRGC